MRSHPSRADKDLSALCDRKGLNVSGRVIQSMKERGALRRPETKVSSYPKDAWRTVDALIKHGWRSKAKPATFLTFMDGHPFTAKGVRWSIGEVSPPLPSARWMSDQPEDEIEQAREAESDELAEKVLSSRNPEQVGLRKMLRSVGIDPAAAAHDLALAIAGSVPPVETERYEPTTDEFLPAPVPWFLKFLSGVEVESGVTISTTNWESDPLGVIEDIKDMYAWLASPDSMPPIDLALRVATEEQMSAARDEVRNILGAIPHLATPGFVGGMAGAFLFALAMAVDPQEEVPGEQ